MDAHRSVCVLMPGPGAAARARERLALMITTQDGYALAEADLRMRGPGEMWGTLQRGLPRLRLADLGRDQAILERAGEAAAALAERDPRLVLPQHGALREALVARYPEPLEIALAG